MLQPMLLLYVLLYNTLLLVVLLGKLLISQKFGIHSFCGNGSCLLGLFDPIGVSLVGFIMCASVLLLLKKRKKRENREGVSK